MTSIKEQLVAVLTKPKNRKEMLDGVLVPIPDEVYEKFVGTKVDELLERKSFQQQLYHVCKEADKHAGKLKGK